MKYIQLGNTNLKVSRVCMGCMGFGDPKNGMHTWTLPKQNQWKSLKTDWIME